MAECESELKRLLMKVKEESENAGLKLSIQQTKFMTSVIIHSEFGDKEIKPVTVSVFFPIYLP